MSMSMSMSEFDWQSVYARLQGVRDDDIRSAAGILAHDIWARRAARGKACSVPTLCWRAVQLARRHAKRANRVAAESPAVEQIAARAVERSEQPVLRLERLTDRQRDIARLLMAGVGQSEIASRIGCSQPTVSRECERIADQL